MWVWIAQNTLVAAALAVVVAASCRALRARPALCHLMWLLVFVVLVAPPLPVSFQPGAKVRAALGGWIEKAQEAPARAESVASTARPVSNPTALAPPELPTTLPALESPSSTAGAVSAWTSVAPGTWAGLLWVGGALVVLARQLFRARAFHRLVKLARRPGARLTEAVREVAQRIGVDQPEIRVIAGIGSPAVWCLGPPRLLWPAADADDAVEWEPSLIAHELAHLARRDHWVSRAEVVATALCWWNPVYWVIRRQVHHYAELSCDAWAMWAYPMDRRAFAGALIDVQEKVDIAPVALHGLCATNTEFKNFERRLNMIMNRRVSRSVSRGTAALAVLTTALVLPGFSGDVKKSDWASKHAPAARSVSAIVSNHRLLDKADEMFETGHHDQAIELYREVLDGDPHNGIAHHRLGYILIGRGELEKAGWHFERQLAAGHAVATATYNLACTASLMGDTTKAADYLHQAIARGFDNTKLMQTDTDLDAVRATSHFTECVALAKRGVDLKEALASLDESYDLERTLEVRRAYSEVVSHDGKALEKLGHLLLEAGEFAEAAQAFKRQAEVGHNAPTAHYNTACAQARAGAKDDALYSLERAVKSGMSYVGAADDKDLDSLRGGELFEELQGKIVARAQHAKEAKYALESGDAAKAVAYLEGVLASDHLNAESRGWAQHKMAAALCELGRHKEALGYLKAAVNGGYLADQSAFDMAACFSELGDEAEALAHVRHALDLGFADAGAVRARVAAWNVPADVASELVERAEKAAKKSYWDKSMKKREKADYDEAAEHSKKEWKKRSPSGAK